MPKVSCSYLSHVYKNSDEIVSQANRCLLGVIYDTLVGTGLSGALVVPVLARAFNKKWLIVRKPNDGSHTFEPAEGEFGDQWVFVDDLVSTGTTRARVLEVMENLSRRYGYPTKCVGEYLYNDGEFHRYGGPNFPDKRPKTKRYFDPPRDEKGRFVKAVSSDDGPESYSKIEKINWTESPTIKFGGVFSSGFPAAALRSDALTIDF